MRSILLPLVILTLHTTEGKAAPEVILNVYNSKGETAEWLTSGENTTYECLYSGGYYTAFKDGQDRYILRYSAQDGTTTPGTDFENLVSDYSGSPENLTMKLLYPHCSKDGMVKCEVMDSNADSKINMSKLDFADPAKNVEIHKVKACAYNCSVEDILPKGRFEWLGGCEEDSTTMIRDEKCLFSQSSTARCNSSYHGQQIACEFIHENNMRRNSTSMTLNCPQDPAVTTTDAAVTTTDAETTTDAAVTTTEATTTVIDAAVIAVSVTSAVVILSGLATGAFLFLKWKVNYNGGHSDKTNTEKTQEPYTQMVESCPDTSAASIKNQKPRICNSQYKVGPINKQIFEKP